MANITNPQAIAFSNNRVRPLSEKLRALQAEIEDTLNEWYGGVNNLTANDSSPLVDNRTAEGISALTGADINSVITLVATLNSSMTANGVPGIIQKPCVRPLSAQ